MAPNAVGIDIGGTYVRAALISEAGAVVQRAVLPTPADACEADLVAVVRQALSSLDPVARRLPVGLVLPGVWSRDTGVMTRANNLPRLEGVSVPTLASQAVGRPVDVLDSDVVAAGWAQWFAMAPRRNRVVYLSLGTGVGGAVIADGKIVRDAEGGTHRFGALLVDESPDAPQGRAGLAGTLEGIVCESTEPPISRRAVEALGRALVCILAAHRADVVALGGGRIDRQPESVDSIRIEYKRRAGERGVPAIRVERAPLCSDDAGVIGAALLALQRACAG